MADLMRAGGEWAALSDEQRRADAGRLLFARHRLNRGDRLRNRVEPEGRGETVRRTLVIDLWLGLLVALTALDAAAGRIWRWRP